MSMKEAEINSFHIRETANFPPKANPFCHDSYHVGESIGSNVVMMQSNHSKDKCEYIILIHIPTGKRICINMPKE